MKMDSLNVTANFLKIFITGLVLIIAGCKLDSVDDPLSFVDPDIGGVGLLLQPTRPTAQLPNEFIRVYPVRDDYLDDRIRYFPLSLISHRNGELFGIMPFAGDVSNDPSSAWDNQLEVTTPYYLSTWLQDYDITVEFTPSAKSGFFRFTYPDNIKKGLTLLGLEGVRWKMKEADAIAGVQVFNGMKAYVYAACSQNFILKSPGDSLEGNSYLLFSKTEEQVTEFRYGISLISEEQAKMNLLNDISSQSFDSVKEKAKSEWERVLGKIKIKGGTDDQKRVFYTALYRCFERMVNINENGKYYSNYDSAVHISDTQFYVDDWIWDTYLALHPLRIILDPGLETKMIQSYVEMYRQSGWLPTFPVLYGDTPCMNGFHSSVMILDAWRKGLRSFDIWEAYEGMKKNSTEATMLPWKNGPACSLDIFYRNRGFYPALRPGEKETVSEVHSWEKRQAVAVTLGHSYDDWAVAELASELGFAEDRRIFSERSLNYRNLWDSDKGFFMPKNAEGKWIGIDPAWDGGMGGRDYYDENNGWTYIWQVQHNLPDLVNLMGGKSAFENRLDQLFTTGLGRSKYETWSKFPDFSGIVGQFSMGNEPSFHIPYLYNLTDSPWKTQKKIRMLLDAWFRDDIFGIPGDEDGGGMSAFVVFSMIGFYPLTPGIPEYTIGSPVFEEVTIDLPSGRKFTIEAPGAGDKNKYIQRALFNNNEMERPWFTHKDLEEGGVLRIEMGPYPNRNLWVRKTF